MRRGWLAGAVRAAGGTLTHPDSAIFKMLQIKFDDSGIVRAYSWTATP